MIWPGQGMLSPRQYQQGPQMITILFNDLSILFNGLFLENVIFSEPTGKLWLQKLSQMSRDAFVTVDSNLPAFLNNFQGMNQEIVRTIKTSMVEIPDVDQNFLCTLMVVSAESGWPIGSADVGNLRQLFINSAGIYEEQGESPFDLENNQNIQLMRIDHKQLRLEGRVVGNMEFGLRVTCLGPMTRNAFIPVPIPKNRKRSLVMPAGSKECRVEKERKPRKSRQDINRDSYLKKKAMKSMKSMTQTLSEASFSNISTGIVISNVSST